MSIVVFWWHSEIAAYLLLDYDYTLRKHPVFCYIDAVASTVFDVNFLLQRKLGECVCIY